MCVVNSHIRSNKIYPKWHYVCIYIYVYVYVGNGNKLWPRGPKYLPKMLNTVVSTRRFHPDTVYTYEIHSQLHM